jgi:hypothetical protein
MLFLGFLAAGCGSLPQEKYDKIKVGMTFQEVRNFSAQALRMIFFPMT